MQCIPIHPSVYVIIVLEYVVYDFHLAPSVYVIIVFEYAVNDFPLSPVVYLYSTCNQFLQTGVFPSMRVNSLLD